MDSSRRANGSDQRLSAGLWAIRTGWLASPVGFIGIVGCTLARGLVPLAFALAIRGLINAAATTTERPELGFAPIGIWILAAFLVALLDAGATLLQQFYSERLRGDLTSTLNSRVLHHAGSLDLPYFERSGNREIVEHIQRDPGSRFYQFLMEVQRAVLGGFQVLSLMLLLVWLVPLIVPVAAVLALPFLLFQWRLARARFQAEQHRTVKRRWTRWFLQRVTAPETIGEVKLLGIGGLLARRYSDIMRELRDQDRRLQWRQFAGSAVFALLTTLAFFGLFAWIAQQVVDGALTIGDLAIFGGAVVRLRASLDSGIRATAAAYEQGLFVKMLREFLGAKPVVRDVSGLAAASPVTTVAQDDASGNERHGVSVEIEHISFAYPDTGKTVLRDLSFEIAAGETVAIVGENGSGKSTLAKLLARLYDPDVGEIRLDGRPLPEYPLSALHRSVSLLGQVYGRYEASMAENIAYGDWERLRDDRAEVERLAAHTGVDRIADGLPGGLDAPLGREFGANDLSGGQWQRVAITRALARPARLLILDEPTSNIDARAEHDVFAAVARAARGRTTVIISHRFSTLRMADRILVLQAGHLVEQGGHDALLAAGGQYARLYRLHERYRIGADAVSASDHGEAVP